MIDNLVILVGGKATRLYPVTQMIAKAMLDIDGEPFIAHQLRLLKRKGIKKVVICAGYLGEQVKNFVGNGQDFGLKVEFSFDGERLLGTGGAIKKALALLSDDFFVLYGDSYLDSDFKAVAESFRRSKKSGLMTVLRNNDQWDKSNVAYKNNKIIKYDKKDITPDMEYIDYGLGILNKRAFEGFSEMVLDLADVYQALVKKSEMSGYEIKERFYEIGSFNGLAETKAYIMKNKKKESR